MPWPHHNVTSRDRRLTDEQEMQMLDLAQEVGIPAACEHFHVTEAVYKGAKRRQLGNTGERTRHAAEEYRLLSINWVMPNTLDLKAQCQYLMNKAMDKPFEEGDVIRYIALRKCLMMVLRRTEVPHITV